MRECYDERGFENRSFNLYDSYGYAVYVDGSVRAQGFLSQSAASEGKKWYGNTVEGSSAISEFFNVKYKSSGGIELVIAAAMPYAQVLENGGASNGRFTYKHKYKVISMAYDKLKELQGRYPGSTITNIIGGKVQA